MAVTTAAFDAASIAAMGIQEPANARWSEAHDVFAALQRKTGDVAGILAGFSRALRDMVQSGSLARGAYLFVQGRAA